jgi:hypothetical protein
MTITGEGFATSQTTKEPMAGITVTVDQVIPSTSGPTRFWLLSK